MFKLDHPLSDDDIRKAIEEGYASRRD